MELPVSLPTEVVFDMSQALSTDLCLGEDKDGWIVVLNELQYIYKSALEPSDVECDDFETSFWVW